MGPSPSPPAELQQWTYVWVYLGILLLGLLAEWRFRNGWGKSTQWWMDNSERVKRMTSLGYALRPWNLGMALNVLAWLLAHAFVSTGADGLGMAAVGVWATALLSILWGIKEFFRPSNWRRSPTWILLLNKRVVMETGRHVAD